MDLSRLSPNAWPPLFLDAPEGLLAALVSAVATLALFAAFAPRLRGVRAESPI